jgi:hypothetical protein
MSVQKATKSAKDTVSAKQAAKTTNKQISLPTFCDAEDSDIDEEVGTSKSSTGLTTKKEDGEMLLVKKPKNAYLRFCDAWRPKIKKAMICEGMDADWRLRLKELGKPFDQSVKPPTEAVGKRCGEIWNSWLVPEHPQHANRKQFELEAETGFASYAKVKVFAKQCNEEARIKQEQEQEAKDLAARGIVGFTHKQMFARFNAVIGDVLQSITEGNAITAPYTKLSGKRLMAEFQKAWDTQAALATATAAAPATPAPQNKKVKTGKTKKKPARIVADPDDDSVRSGVGDDDSVHSV